MSYSPMTRIFVAAAVVAAAVLCAGGAADAQRYGYYGPRPARAHVAIFPANMYFGGGIVGTKIMNQRGGEELLDDGAGLSLYSGLRLNKTLSLELGWLGSLHNPSKVQTAFGAETDYLVLTGVTADAKIHLETRSRGAKPFLQGGVGVYFLDREQFGTESIGTGFQAGGGFDFRVGPNVDLGVRALYRGLAMGPPEADFNDTFVSAVTLEGNLTIHY